jgi:excisionase family DNA binding protein
MNSNNKSYYTVREIADLLDISRVAVFNKIKKGQIKAKMVGKTYIIDAKEIRGILMKGLDDDVKKRIEKSVIRFIKEYSQTLKLLGKE